MLEDDKLISEYHTHGLKKDCTLNLSYELPENPEINLEALRQVIEAQLAIREDFVEVVLLFVMVSLVIYVLVEQLDTYQLFDTATSAWAVLENAGGGAGMDELSIGQIATENQLWDWMKTGLLPAVQDRNWIMEEAFAWSFNQRNDCSGLNEQGEQCTELLHTNWSTTIGKYDMPWDDSQVRKYNMLIGDVKIEQLRAPFKQCPMKDIISNFSGYKVASWA